MASTLIPKLKAEIEALEAQYQAAEDRIERSGGVDYRGELVTLRRKLDDKRHKLEMEIIGPKDKRPDIALMSDEEVDKFIQKHFDLEEQMIDLKEEYYMKFKEVLPVKKVFRLMEAERDFKRILLERLQEGQRPPYDPE